MPGRPDVGVIDLEMARALRDAGLRWRPAEADRFVIPDRGMDDRVFILSAMTVEIRETPVGAVITFNGTPEWALDSILQAEVVWLPHDHQLREALGPRFRALERVADGMRCVVGDDDRHQTAYTGPTATIAYARALLHQLRHG